MDDKPLSFLLIVLNTQTNYLLSSLFDPNISLLGLVVYLDSSVFRVHWVIFTLKQMFLLLKSEI